MRARLGSWAPLTALMLALAGCGETAPDEPGAAPAGGTITFWDGQWESLDVNNAIAAFVLEHGYGYDTETVVLAAPVMEQALPQGDIDVVMELWAVNRVEWYEQVIAEGTVIDIGPVLERATQGYYVPRFVIEGDDARGIEPAAPDLESVFDLPDYADVFADPEDPGRAALVNCPPDWECAAITEVKFAAYGLLDDVNIRSPGSPGALDAELVGAYERGEPVVGYYWEPTALMGRFDFVQLDEPEWTEECEAANEQAREQGLASADVPAPADVPEEAGCGFQTHPVTKGIHAGLQERAPEAVEFLERMEVGTDPLNEAGAFIVEHDADAQDAALWFFENYDHWRDWLDGEPLERVEGALRDAGVDV
ncbi:MAG TPA: glycine betaine ABC transporter substrate-binding protein [Egibacteraceae bacterium]|jgi:glycine betaine/proline transport system substrate-binding protein|nr:glycine betaine ABC transporter substrate-binding protein [Egibacteraceae bacterium]